MGNDVDFVELTLLKKENDELGFVKEEEKNEREQHVKYVKRPFKKIKKGRRDKLSSDKKNSIFFKRINDRELKNVARKLF